VLVLLLWGCVPPAYLDSSSSSGNGGGSTSSSGSTGGSIACQADLATDPNNCGACGKVCGAVQRQWISQPAIPTARAGVATVAVGTVLYAIGGNNIQKNNDAFDTLSQKWTPKASMPTGRVTNAAVVNGVVYMVGGAAGGVCTNIVEAYDTMANTWSKKASMPTPRCYPAVAAVNGLIYAAGGSDTCGATKYNIVEVYDPMKNTWSSAPAMPTCRQDASAVSLGGRLYVIGGWAGPGGQCQGGTAAGALDVNEVFDPGSNAWTSKKAMAGPRYRFGAAVVGAKIFVVGGTNDAVSAIVSVDSYDPTADAWSRELTLPVATSWVGAASVGAALYAVSGQDLMGAPTNAVRELLPAGPGRCNAAACTPTCTPTQSPPALPTPRDGLAAATGADGRIYAIGGQLAGGLLTNEVDAYDPCSNTWTVVAPLPTATYELAATTGLDGRIYALGGAVPGKSQANVYAYDAPTNTWLQEAPMSTARQGHGAATGPDGRIYVVGGLGATAPPLLGSTEAYTPSAPGWTAVAPLNQPRLQHAVVTGPDGRIYAIGGNDYQCNVFASVEVYDTKANMWTASASLPGPMDRLTGALGPDGRIYAIKGTSSGCSPTATATAIAYDVLMNSWSAVAAFPSPRESTSSATGQGANGFVYVIGGGEGKNAQATSSVVAYDVATNMW
jgi:N-acetylneuraminic acid mutarotase